MKTRRRIRKKTQRGGIFNWLRKKFSRKHPALPADCKWWHFRPTQRCRFQKRMASLLDREDDMTKLDQVSDTESLCKTLVPMQDPPELKEKFVKRLDPLLTDKCKQQIKIASDAIQKHRKTRQIQHFKRDSDAFQKLRETHRRRKTRQLQHFKRASDAFQKFKESDYEDARGSDEYFSQESDDDHETGSNDAKKLLVGVQNYERKNSDARGSDDDDLVRVHDYEPIATDPSAQKEFEKFYRDAHTHIKVSPQSYNAKHTLNLLFKLIMTPQMNTELQYHIQTFLGASNKEPDILTFLITRQPIRETIVQNFKEAKLVIDFANETKLREFAQRGADLDLLSSKIIELFAFIIMAMRAGETKAIPAPTSWTEKLEQKAEQVAESAVFSSLNYLINKKLESAKPAKRSWWGTRKE